MVRGRAHTEWMNEDVFEDGLDDIEFAKYMEDTKALKRSRSLPAVLKKQTSQADDEEGASNDTSSTSAALSVCHSVVENSSQPDDTWAVNYVDTMCSFPQHKSSGGYNAFRNLVTGGAADGWYSNGPASPPGSEVIPQQSPCLGTMLCVMPINNDGQPYGQPIPMTVNPYGMPTMACGVPSSPVGSAIEVGQQFDATSPTNAVSPTGRTPLRSTAALFKPATGGQQEVVLPSAAPKTRGPKVEPSENAPPTVTKQNKTTEQKDEEPAQKLTQQVDETIAKTTLMLRNLPATFSRSNVINVLQSKGYADHIVFMYVPMNLRSSGNFGYAFVDFDCTHVAEQCKQEMEGFTGWLDLCEKALEVAWSETQGLDAHIGRYRDSPLMHDSVDDELKPAMFKKGDRVTFPAPTKPIRAPRLRRSVEQMKAGNN